MNQPLKIAVLGGGISSLSAIYDLTSAADWKDKFDITVYQLGWKLGGKGASSRDPQYGNRIEEHGLHIWLGFYENAFRLMRDCYSNLRGHPLCFSGWEEAFKPHSFVVLEERIGEEWVRWPTTFPTNMSLPGDGKRVPSIWDYVVMLVQWLREAFESATHLQPQAEDTNEATSWRTEVACKRFKTPRDESVNHGARLLRVAHRKVRRLPKHPRYHKVEDHETILSLLRDFSGWFRRQFESELSANTSLRRAFIPIDLFCAVARGLISDRALLTGLEALDSMEFRDWLQKHGASSVSLNSAWVRGAYDLGFSYEDGDKNKPNIAAGVAVRAALRMVFTYKGAVLWKMQAGMGETVFTPLYLILKSRGVKFKFFHKVEKLHVSADGRLVGSVDGIIQAHALNDSYDPLVDVGGLGCWRNEPDFNQLQEGAALKSGGVNLESNWCNWSSGTFSLKAGQDYDTILLGIPLAALRTICSEIIDRSPRWELMMTNVKTIQTQGFQLWLDKDLAACGWTLDSPILGSYVEPLNTWADMTHLLAKEEWPKGTEPKQIAYFCGVLKDTGDPSHASFPLGQQKLAQEAALHFIRKSLGYLWPGAVGNTGFDWDILHCDAPLRHEQRFSSQYWRPNIDPSERYVLAVAGSTNFRLRVDQSGFQNLVLTGDWVRNGFNSPGCIETSVISGRQAARYIAGLDYPIIGEDDFPVPLTWLGVVFDFLRKCFAGLLSLSESRIVRRERATK
jgi:uncharacterized protein with NAD-binding domain and iron-sulfur cluster